MKTELHCDLISCFLCQNCLPEWLPAVRANKRNIRFKKGDVIFEEGTAVTGIYFLYSGRVKVHTRWGGKQLILYFAQKGDMVGYRGLGKERVYPVTATALEDAVVCFVDIAFFESTLKINHQLTYTLMQFYADELQQAERRMRNLAHMDVKGRVAETLLMLHEKFGVDSLGAINILLAKQDLAAYAGTTYETFYRMITELTNEQVVSLAGKHITVLDAAALKRLTLNS